MQSLHLPILFYLSLVLPLTPRTHALTLRLPNQHTHNHLNTRNSTTTNSPPNPAPAKGGKDFWRDLAGLADKYDFFDFWRGLVGGGKKKHGSGNGEKSTTTVFVMATPVAQSPSASPSSLSFPTASLATTTARKGGGEASYAVVIPSVLPSVLPSPTTSSTPSSSSSTTTSPSSVSNPSIPYEDDPNPPITVITISDDFPNEPTPTPEPSTSTSTSTNTTLLDTLTPGPTYPALTVSTTTEPVPTTTATTGIEDNAPDEPEPIFSILPWIPCGEDISDNVTTPLTTTAVGGGDEGYGYGYEGEEEDGGTNVVQVTSTATSTTVVWVTLSRPSSSPYSPYGVSTLPIPASLSTSTTTTSTPSPATTQTSPLDTQPSSTFPSLPISIPIPIPFPYYTTDPSSNLTSSSSSSSSSALSTLQNLCNASTTSHTSHNPLLLSLPLLPLIIPSPSSAQNTSHTKITNQPPFFFPGCTPLPLPLPLPIPLLNTTTSSPYPQRRQNCTLLHHALSTCHQTTKQDIKFLLTIPVPSILPLLLLSSPATSAGTNQSATTTTTAGLLARTLFSGLRLGDGGEDDNDGELDGFDVRVPRKWGAGTREGDVVEGFIRELRGVVEWDGRVREEVDGRNWAYGGRKGKGERKRGKKMVLVGWED